MDPSRSRLILALLVTIAGSALLAPQAGAQASRTWVSGTGDDVNPCSRTAPCKTLAGAFAKTMESGEINALDAGGYGAVNITKAITIDLSESFGSIVNADVNGVVVNAGPDDDVTLRGLDILGAGPPNPSCAYAGINGVRILQARSVRLEDSQISQQETAVKVEPTAPVDVLVNRVDIGNNCFAGIKAAPGAGGSARLTVRDSTIMNSATGLSVGGAATAWLTGTLALELMLSGSCTYRAVLRAVGADGRVDTARARLRLKRRR